MMLGMGDGTRNRGRPRARYVFQEDIEIHGGGIITKSRRRIDEAKLQGNTNDRIATQIYLSPLPPCVIGMK